MEFKKQQEKYSWNPDSICHSDNACFPNKSPSVDKVSERLGLLPRSSLAWLGGVYLHQDTKGSQAHAGKARLG